MEPFDLTGVKEYASEIAQPLRDRLVEDICRRVKEAGAITTTAEYEIYRAEQLGLAEKEIKAAIAEQSGINAGAVDMLFGDTVSYTHLDVYKRQPQHSGRNGAVPGGIHV